VYERNVPSVRYPTPSVRGRRTVRWEELVVRRGSGVRDDRREGKTSVGKPGKNGSR
jgi:hypothetical protein